MRSLYNLIFVDALPILCLLIKSWSSMWFMLKTLSEIPTESECLFFQLNWLCTPSYVAISTVVSTKVMRLRTQLCELTYITWLSWFGTFYCFISLCFNHISFGRIKYMSHSTLHAPEGKPILTRGVAIELLDPAREFKRGAPGNPSDVLPTICFDFSTWSLLDSNLSQNQDCVMRYFQP